MHRLIASALALATLSAPASARDPLPGNVTTDEKGRIVRSIDFSLASTPGVEFAKVKLCLVRTVTNDAVRIKDSSGSFVGGSGTYYSNGSAETVAGGSLFKYVDESAKVAVVSGTMKGGKLALGLTSQILKFDLESSVTQNGVGLIFTNIKQAQEDTGSLANNGFQDLGTWGGSGFKGAYGSFEKLSTAIKACITA